MIMCACFRWKSYYHMRVYFNFHCYIQNKPIAKMFIAIVNTGSLYSLLLFVLVALFQWWAQSRVKTPVPYKHKATGIDASTTIIVAVVSLCGFAHAHGHMLHKQWSSSIAASTTIAAASSMLSGHVTHLTTWREVALYGVNTKDAAGLTALHVVCTNRVALFQAMQEDASNDHEQSRLLWCY